MESLRLDQPFINAYGPRGGFFILFFLNQTEFIGRIWNVPRCAKIMVLELLWKLRHKFGNLQLQIFCCQLVAKSVVFRRSLILCINAAAEMSRAFSF